MSERPLIALEAEHGVLGALMHEPELCESIGSFLAPADFSSEDHSALYSMILGAHSKKMRPDSITLAEIRDELPSGELTIVYASEIMRNMPSAANGPHYARIVLERSRARKLYEVGQALMQLAQQRGTVSEQIAQAQQMTMDLVSHEERPDVVSIREALVPVFDEMETRWKGIKAVGLDFNLPDLDRVVQGLRPGNLAIIAGRPGTGKTVLGVGLADHIAVSKGGSALIFSLEMSQSELAKRSLASLSEVAQGLIDSGKALDNDEYCLRMNVAVNKLAAADVRICDKPALTFSRICSIARFEHRARPLSVIVIDYLGLIAPEQNSRLQNRNQELGAISRGLKALAKELGIPVVALAQLNRGIESRADSKPKMSDLRDSGEIEQDADVIIMAHRDINTDRGRNGITEIDVVKCRHAKPDFCLLQFQGEYARFVSCAQQREEDQDDRQQSAPSSLRSMLGKR